MLNSAVGPPVDCKAGGTNTQGSEAAQRDQPAAPNLEHGEPDAVCRDHEEAPHQEGRHEPDLGACRAQ